MTLMTSEMIKIGIRKSKKVIKQMLENAKVTCKNNWFIRECPSIALAFMQVYLNQGNSVIFVMGGGGGAESELDI